MAITVASPLLLLDARFLSDSQVARMSDLGQAYGGIAALLSALALLGLAVGISIQLRELRQSRLQLLREQHQALLGRALDDPTLAAVWGGFGNQAALSVWKAEAYANLIMSQWEMMHELGSLSDTELRANAALLFQSAAAWNYWSRVQPLRSSLATSPVRQKFHAVVSSVHAAAPHPKQ